MKFLALPIALALPATAFEFNDFPESDHILLGTVVTEVQPAHFQRVRATLPGNLHLKLPEKGTRLLRGTIWAELDPEKLDLDERAFEIARDTLEERETTTLRLEHARSRAEIENRLSELDRQSAMLGKIIGDPELAELYLAEEGKDGRGIEEVRQMRTRLNDEVKLLRRALKFIGTPRHDELELEALQLKLKQQELELQNRRNTAVFTMPFDGEITFLPPLPPEGKPLTIEPGNDLALIEDFSTINARVITTRPEWRMLPTNTLKLRISAPGNILHADFSRSLTEEVAGRQELTWYFAFPPDQLETARRLAGGRLAGELIHVLPEQARIIPKVSLILADPDAFRRKGWQPAIEKLSPGARLIAIGATELAIVPPPSK